MNDKIGITERVVTVRVLKSYGALAIRVGFDEARQLMHLEDGPIDFKILGCKEDPDDAAYVLLTVQAKHLNKQETIEKLSSI